ncbi:MAG: response regulator [Candidatus Omnitrophica bacterium]|nr:response regulator [Candidatus Omnitrophota bacterium]
MSKQKILMIEDEIDLAEVAKIGLEDAGYEVILAGDGETGVKKAREEKPDIILLDVALPGLMDGHEICKCLQEEDNKDIPIIILTASAVKEVEEESLMSGAVGFIKKPYDLNDLIKKIKRVI